MHLLPIISLFAALAAALHLEVKAENKPLPVCVRDFVQEGQLVVVNVKAGGHRGDGQRLDLKIVDLLGNEHRSKKDLVGNIKVAFTSGYNAAFDVCFINQLERRSGHQLSRDVELEIESGAAARDWNAVQAAEKLKPAEVELKKVEEMTKEIAAELQYLKTREARMRDTNESTNSRVKYFSVLVVFSLVGFGTWQILYLRHYFKVKHII